MKCTNIISVQFTFVGEFDPSLNDEVTRRFVECLDAFTRADDVLLLYSKVFTHEDESEEAD